MTKDAHQEPTNPFETREGEEALDYLSKAQLDPDVDLPSHNQRVNDLLLWADEVGTDTLHKLQKVVVQLEVARHTRRHSAREPEVLARWAAADAPSPDEHYIYVLSALLKEMSVDVTGVSADDWERGFNLDGVNDIAAADDHLWSAIRGGVQG